MTIQCIPRIKQNYVLSELWETMFSGSIRLVNWSVELKTISEARGPAFDVSAVRAAEFSLVWRPLWGPGLGFCPFPNAFKTFFVVSTVKSSWLSMSRHQAYFQSCNSHKSHPPQPSWARCCTLLGTLLQWQWTSHRLLFARVWCPRGGSGKY